jgi:iduronate 2-sulfatase
MLPQNSVYFPRTSNSTADSALGTHGLLSLLLITACSIFGRTHAAETPHHSENSNRPNILLLLVDDLKPTLGCYGDPIAKTPNLDRLAQRGIRFDVACCSQAVCAPSRFALLLGAHPTRTGLYHLSSQLRDRLPDAVTLPQYFARFGYRTESLGKVFHIGHGNTGDPSSFQVPHFNDLVIEYRDPDRRNTKLTREEAFFTNQQLNEIRSLPRGPAWEHPDVPEESYADARVATETTRRLEAACKRRQLDGTPFFIAAGFARPHLPFSVPQKFWDLYDSHDFQLPNLNSPPIDAPVVAAKKGGEITNYSPIPEHGHPTADQARKLIHGYYASVSYMDAQAGLILHTLDRLQLWDSTIVVLWGDHGFHLGDHGFWTKHTNYEHANRIPLIIAAPDCAASNSSTQQPAGSVDIFPTLAELAGLPHPQVPQGLDGTSLAPVLASPATRVRDHTFHVFPRSKLGRAIRTERYRLVEWRSTADATEPVEYELYDYELDPLETQNQAAIQPQLVQQLSHIIQRYPAQKP